MGVSRGRRRGAQAARKLLTWMLTKWRSTSASASRHAACWAEKKEDIFETSCRSPEKKATSSGMLAAADHEQDATASSMVPANASPRARNARRSSAQRPASTPSKGGTDQAGRGAGGTRHRGPGAAARPQRSLPNRCVRLNNRAASLLLSAAAKPARPVGRGRTSPRASTTRAAVLADARLARVKPSSPRGTLPQLDCRDEIRVLTQGSDDGACVGGCRRRFLCRGRDHSNEFLQSLRHRKRSGPGARGGQRARLDGQSSSWSCSPHVTGSKQAPAPCS